MKIMMTLLVFFVNILDLNVRLFIFNMDTVALITDRKEFIKHINDEKLKFKPFGKKVGSF